MNGTKTINSIVYIFMLLGYLIAMVVISDVSPDILPFLKFVLSWIGIIQFVYHLRIWKKLSGTYFTMQVFFLFFCLLFNYGQCILWAFGFHSIGEIGATGRVFYTIHVDDLIICKSQLITLITTCSINIGMIFTYKNVGLTKFIEYKKPQHIKQSVNIIYFFVLPFSLYCTVKDMIQARIYGYWALYYGEAAYSTNTVVVLISMMYFTSLIGVLICNDAKSMIWKFAITVYFFSSLLSFASGDRGFVYHMLLLLFWYMQKKAYRKIKIRKLIIWGILGYIGVSFLSAVTKIRGGQVTIGRLIEASFSADNSPIVSSLLEMGGSMAPLVSIVSIGHNPYPYGNTFLFAIPGMVTERIITFLGIPYESLAIWFPFDYLHLGSGTGFSLIAELYMNFGAILGPAFAIFFGLLFGRLFSMKKNSIYSEIFSLASVGSLISIVRNTFQTGTKHFFYGVVVYFVLLRILNELHRTRRKSIH